ncbi:hypothetical protein C7446_2550 [Kushneria sinocarnis]|uniref:Uncharacterized protein n=1 Tax=Kushneria sinocarnis TaxID=595502 RepID=A0A420WUM7_9GAMM|nr:hypothetical protein C7446_2550 [Kushneria sinocarnis]
MKWQKLSDYHAVSECGRFKLSFTHHHQTSLYTLWHGGDCVKISHDKREIERAANQRAEVQS